MSRRSELEIEKAIGEIVEDVLALRSSAAEMYFASLFRDAAKGLWRALVANEGSSVEDIQDHLDALAGEVDGAKDALRSVSDELHGIMKLVQKKKVQK